MARYQIRTPENCLLEDVVERMAEKSWEVLEAWNVFRRPSTQEDIRHFKLATHQALEPYIRTYKLCGVSNVCSEKLQSTPWAFEAHSLDASPWDLVYHLFPKDGLEEFLEDLSWKALQSIRDFLKPDMETGTLSMLRIVFRYVLGEYMFYNPVCGKTDLCVYSSSAPIEPWKREERSH